MRFPLSFGLFAPLCLILAACDPDAPDQGPVSPVGNPIVGIVPAVGAPRVAYCDRQEVNGRDFLVVSFRNTGESTSPANMTTVTVDFFDHGVETFTMKPIAPGTTEAHDVPMPACFNPDCEFEIRWSNQPTVAGICIG